MQRASRLTAAAGQLSVDLLARSPLANKTLAQPVAAVFEYNSHGMIRRWSAAWKPVHAQVS